MKNTLTRRCVCGVLALGFALATLQAPQKLRAGAGAQKRPREVRFKKITLDREFRSEGVAVADKGAADIECKHISAEPVSPTERGARATVDRDGQTDGIAGNLWYEVPNWPTHEIQPLSQSDAAKGYSNSFINFAADINNDG